MAVDPVTGFAGKHTCLVLCELAFEPSQEREPARAGDRAERLPIPRRRPRVPPPPLR